MNITIRNAGTGDGATVFGFIHELAVYEKLAHEVVASAETIEEALTDKNPTAYAVIAEADGVPIGMALYFYNYSTFLGRKGLYIEDLYVQPEKRGLGIGQRLLKHLAAHAISQGCGRMEWAVLDWNEPSIQFYKSLGANSKDEWIIYRLDGTALQELAGAASLAA